MGKIKIVSLKTKNKNFSAFKNHEWELIHPKHYGHKLDWAYWDQRPLNLEAKVGKEIVGALKGGFIAGVLEIFEIIVKHDQLGQGIGKALLEKAEAWAKQNGGHEVFLATGTKWDAVGFYEKMGYAKVAEFPNHYSKTDFVIFRKFLPSTLQGESL